MSSCEYDHLHLCCYVTKAFGFTKQTNTKKTCLFSCSSRIRIFYVFSYTSHKKKKYLDYLFEFSNIIVLYISNIVTITRYLDDLAATWTTSPYLEIVKVDFDEPPLWLRVRRDVTSSPHLSSSGPAARATSCCNKRNVMISFWKQYTFPCIETSGTRPRLRARGVLSIQTSNHKRNICVQISGLYRPYRLGCAFYTILITIIYYVLTILPHKHKPNKIMSTM